MKHFLLLLLACCVLSARANANEPATPPPIEKEKLVGTWSHEDEVRKRVVRYDFRADGTFTAEVQPEGQVVQRVAGRWNVEEQALVLTYASSSAGWIAPGQQDRSQLVRLDDASFTLSADQQQFRTYFRVKEEDAAGGERTEAADSTPAATPN